MMSFGWKGFGVWRWSEEEKEDALGQGPSLDTDKHQQPGLVLRNHGKYELIQARPRTV
jgi:hypothetical protein